MSRPYGVLVVDDEAFVRESIARVLAAEGLRTDTAGGVAEALARLASVRFDVVISDLRMPGGDVFALLEGQREAADRTPIVVITGMGTVREAVRAMKLGAFDFLQKPVDPDELIVVATRAAAHRRMVSEFDDLRDADIRRRRRRVLVGESEAMERVRTQVARCAVASSNVLVTGESGTGKGLAAEALHEASSPEQVLLPLRCANLSVESLVAEFSTASTRGARLEEVGGTVLLDEIGLLGAPAQEWLLAWLDRGADRAPIRVVATTNKNLEEETRTGAFRADLFFRLNVLSIAMPPLREHRDDIPALVAHFLSVSPEADASVASTEVLDVLGSYNWPGNVRELENVLERARFVSGESSLDADVVRSVLEPTFMSAPPSVPRGDLNLRGNLEVVEKEIVLRALAQAEGVKKRAAYLLGIDPRNLGYYLRKHHITDV